MSMVPFLCKLIGLCIMWEACLYIKEARLLIKPMLSDPPIFSQSLSMSHENYKHCNIAFFFFPWWSKVKCNPVCKKEEKLEQLTWDFAFSGLKWVCSVILNSQVLFSKPYLISALELLTFYCRFRQMAIYLSCFQSLRKQWSYLHLHPLMIMWNKEKFEFSKQA